MHVTGQSESTCSVWLEGLDLDRVVNGDGSCAHEQENELESSSNEHGERWPIGAVRVTTTTLWAVLEEALTSLALHHLDTLARYASFCVIIIQVLDSITQIEYVTKAKSM